MPQEPITKPCGCIITDSPIVIVERCDECRRWEMYLRAYYNLKPLHEKIAEGEEVLIAAI